MKLKLARFNTLPSKNDHFWQIVLLPTIAILNNITTIEDYLAFNFEWLFWSFTIILEK
jgi:hypothetical protein